MAIGFGRERELGDADYVKTTPGKVGKAVIVGIDRGGAFDRGDRQDLVIELRLRTGLARGASTTRLPFRLALSELHRRLLIERSQSEVPAWRMRWSLTSCTPCVHHDSNLLSRAANNPENDSLCRPAGLQWTSTEGVPTIGAATDYSPRPPLMTRKRTTSPRPRRRRRSVKT